MMHFVIRILGAVGQNHLIIPNTNHFIREDAPQLMAQYLIQFLKYVSLIFFHFIYPTISQTV
jgi:hypothetical protein